MNNREERITHLNGLASNSTDTKAFEAAVKAHLDAGFSVFEIAEATHGTEWRYEISKSGSVLRLARLTTLIKAHAKSLRSLIQEVPYFDRAGHELKVQYRNHEELERDIAGVVLPREFSFQRGRLAQCLNDHECYDDHVGITEFDGHEDSYYYGEAFDLAEFADDFDPTKPFERDATSPWTKNAYGIEIVLSRA